MRWLSRTLDTAEANLALDEALLLEAEAGRGGEVLRVWEWPAPAVVLGSGGKVADDVDEAACAAGGVPVLRRSSGGGTVLLGAGCLCYTLVLSYRRHEALGEIRPSYHWVLERVLAALGVGGEVAGISDLALGGRKFSGNAQQRKRDHLLHHGTILYAADPGLIARYLRQPPRQPEYRAGRDHGAFVRNLDVPRERIVAGLRGEWGAREEMSEWPEELVGRLVEEKYGRAEWARRR
jgi:lipoate-protein ligase A